MINIPKKASPNEEFRLRYTIKCKNCGSENVVCHFEESYSYSEYTQGPGNMRFGCNDCNDNYMYASL